jgi:hypothetical protein
MGSKRSVGRTLVGIAAIVVLIVLALALPRWGELRLRAVVEAGHTFNLASIGQGSYEWTLRDGRPARGQGIIRQRVLRFERSDLVELELMPGLSNGDLVTEDQQLASFHSPRTQRRVTELVAMRESLGAERALLEAGGRPEEVREARARLNLAEAAREGELPQLERLRALADQGLVTDAELEAAELDDQIREMEIELARAALAVTRSSARPEALAAVDGEIASLDARMAEFNGLLEENRIECPIAGVLEIGGNRNVLRVYDIDEVYLRIPIPEASRYRVHIGDPVDFETPSHPRRTFVGEVVDLGENAINLNGSQIFWASAVIDNAAHELRSGMTGVVKLQLHGEGEGLGRSLWRNLVGA